MTKLNKTNENWRRQMFFRMLIFMMILLMREDRISFQKYPSCPYRSGMAKHLASILLNRWLLVSR